ncbi:MAG: sulfatase-like hydrolase/transferase [Chlorobi bacterium]|nr:sulfatase-like hydrolase/transferase [Chlorobiota bacterium]
MKSIYLACVVTLILLTGIYGSHRTGSQPENGKRPDIVIIFTDDQRHQTIHALGNDETITPNMDRLVEQGMSFTRAHIMGGTSPAVCMPSRAMLMTGRTLFHLEKKGAYIPETDTMMPQVFASAGYQTYGIGKWHNGKSSYARAFTGGGKIFFGGMSNHLAVPVFDFDSTGEYPPEKRYTGKKFSSELFAGEAVRFIHENHQGKPFFLYVAFTAPHDPRMAPAAFTALYPPDKIKIPENFMPGHPFDNGELYIRDEKLAPWPRTPEIIQQNIAAYYAMITHLDKQIGRVLDALEETGDARNTIIVFAGDNGLALGQHGLMGKQNIYDHSVRVPLIFTGPGIPENTRTDALCYLNDIYPTLCELAGLPVPATVEGKSLLPVIEDPAAKVRDEVFLAYRNFQRGLRTDDNWKVIRYNVNRHDTVQLFNLNEDPWEMKNLAPDPAYRDKLSALTDRLYEWMHRLDDPMDPDKPDWGKVKKKNPADGNSPSAGKK